MDLSCFNADSNINSDITLYDENTSNGHMWKGHPPLPPCSSTSPPLPSRCMVCRDHIVHVVCRNLSKSVNLAMECAGRSVDIIESGCPRLPGNIDSPGPREGDQALKISSSPDLQLFLQRVQRCYQKNLLSKSSFLHTSSFVFTFSLSFLSSIFF